MLRKRLGVGGENEVKRVMKVRELLELVPALEAADPEDVVVIDADAKSIWLMNARPGLHPPASESPDCVLTESDMRFLRSLHVSD